MPNTRKYTSAKALRRDVDKYLKSIRTTAKVYETDSFGEYVRDADGDKVIVRGDDGKPMTVERYIVPPDLHNIAFNCKGMCYDTWLKYASGEYDDEDNAYSEVCAYAREICICWAMREVNTRTKGAEGVKWSLQVNYGFGADKREVELGADTRRALEASSLTMEEKLRRIATIPELAAAFEDTDGGDTA